MRTQLVTSYWKQLERVIVWACGVGECGLAVQDPFPCPEAKTLEHVGRNANHAL
jgi:hypothetical protein